MSKEQTKQMDALMGGVGMDKGAAEADSSMSEVERLQRALDAAKVEQGRVKALDARNKELEKELAELRASRQRDDIVSTALTEEERANMAPEFLDAAAKIANASVEKLRQQYEERNGEREQMAKDDFARRVEARFPGFLATVGAGGANQAQWRDFYALNGPSIAAAYSRYDLEALAHFISQFRSELGVRVPSGGQGDATSPDPRNLGSGAGAVEIAPGKAYSQDEIASLYQKADDALKQGREAEHDRIVKEIEKAYQEGRVQ